VFHCRANKRSRTFAPRPKPESSLYCLVCARFARQRLNTLTARAHHRRARVRCPSSLRIPEGLGTREFHTQTLSIGINQTYYTFTLILLIHIVRRGEFPWIEVIKYNKFRCNIRRGRRAPWGLGCGVLGFGSWSSGFGV